MSGQGQQCPGTVEGGLGEGGAGLVAGEHEGGRHNQAGDLGTASNGKRAPNVPVPAPGGGHGPQRRRWHQPVTFEAEGLGVGRDPAGAEVDGGELVREIGQPGRHTRRRERRLSGARAPDEQHGATALAGDAASVQEHVRGRLGGDGIEVPDHRGDRNRRVHAPPHDTTVVTQVEPTLGGTEGQLPVGAAVGRGEIGQRNPKVRQHRRRCGDRHDLAQHVDGECAHVVLVVRGDGAVKAHSAAAPTKATTQATSATPAPEARVLATRPSATKPAWAAAQASVDRWLDQPRSTSWS